MSKLVRNERRKLFVTFLNGVAIAAVGIGGLAQAALMVQTQTLSLSAALFIAVCAILAGALHLAAQGSLRGMEE